MMNCLRLTENLGSKVLLRPTQEACLCQTSRQSQQWSAGLGKLGLVVRTPAGPTNLPESCAALYFQIVAKLPSSDTTPIRIVPLKRILTRGLVTDKASMPSVTRAYSRCGPANREMISPRWFKILRKKQSHALRPSVASQIYPLHDLN